jgi:hypothetical protein
MLWEMTKKNFYLNESTLSRYLTEQIVTENQNCISNVQTSSEHYSDYHGDYHGDIDESGTNNTVSVFKLSYYFLSSSFVQATIKITTGAKDEKKDEKYEEKVNSKNEERKICIDGVNYYLDFSDDGEKYKPEKLFKLLPISSLFAYLWIKEHKEPTVPWTSLLKK